MDIGSLFLVLLLLACPLLMVLMHRGGHGTHGSHEHDGATSGEPSSPRSLEELRRQRDELEVEIARIEEDELDARAQGEARASA